MNYENIRYFIAPNEHFHPLGVFTNKHSKELKFATLFYGNPWQFFESFSYQQIVKWELLHKYRNFSTNILNNYFLAVKVSIQKMISSSWVRIQKWKLCEINQIYMIFSNHT
jgi:hypothetical protein